MKRNGFTLVEILAVILLIGLVTILAVASINSVNKKIKERLLQTKKSTAEQGLLVWNNDNENCFRSIYAIDCIVGIQNNNGCNIEGNITRCEITIGKLADKNIIKYDDIQNKIVINPVDNSSLNNEKICFEYDNNKRIFKYLACNI